MKPETLRDRINQTNAVKLALNGDLSGIYVVGPEDLPALKKEEKIQPQPMQITKNDRK